MFQTILNWNENDNQNRRAYLTKNEKMCLSNLLGSQMFGDLF